MKRFYVSATPYDKKIVTTALESGADAVLVPEGKSTEVKELGLIQTISKDGDIKLGLDMVEITVNSKEDEIKAVSAAKSAFVLIKTKDWKVIPLENLIAQSDKVIAEVKNAEEARTAITILEKGVAGVLLITADLSEIKKTGAVVKGSQEHITLVSAEITKTEQLGMGDRVCIDTCTNMKPGEGMLVGDTSSGMFLINSESVDNPYVEQRPFRVNAGGVHAYTRMPHNKTAYLSELKTGKQVLIVDHTGATEHAVIGRCKTERRPLMLVEAKAGGQTISLVLQNAETIRLVEPDGKPISVVKLQKGDKVLAHIEEGGRHFGMKIKETIHER
jgi:3-dehydroquinate synthase II